MTLEARAQHHHLDLRRSRNRAIFTLSICGAKRLYTEIFDLTEHKET